ncbi:MAG: SDR family oxidoreductase [Actinomycetaceae bacterium]|nr:SDR family oxidoreductase [Actinomycetaceae bacterium]
MRKILVTGATGGIGRAICAELAADTHLLVAGRNPQAVNELVASLPAARPFVADLLDEAAIEAACQNFTELDGLVLNAGIGFAKPVAATSHAEWLEMMLVNVVSAADLTRLLLPALRRSRGQVVAINSGAGFNAGPGWAAYSASKFAFRAFADSLREEERAHIRVTSVHPGRVDTQMQVDLQASFGKPYNPAEHLRPESVAKTVRAALDASPEACIETLSIRPW